MIGFLDVSLIVVVIVNMGMDINIKIRLFNIIFLNCFNMLLVFWKGVLYIFSVCILFMVC